MVPLRKIVGTFIPRPMKDKIWRMYKARQIANKYRQNFDYDSNRFLSWSGLAKNGQGKELLRAKITMDYHKFEKGLSLPEPRVGFGTKVIPRLLDNIKLYQQQYSADETTDIALNALQAYCTFNEESGNDVSSLRSKIDDLRSSPPTRMDGGVHLVTKDDIHSVAKLDLSNFFASRYSVRNFSPEPVDRQLIESAIGMAQKTPSVCNRQAWKVYIFDDSASMKVALDLQHGNRGFGSSAAGILAVTTDVGNYVDIGERNQCWIDGGMFSMSIVYALHSLGLGSCCLNWAVNANIDQALKSATSISESEAVIMLIAYGHLPENLYVAQSPRRDISHMIN